MTKQAPNQIWLDLVRRWHSSQMIDLFNNYRYVLDHKRSLEHMPRLERSLIGNIMAFISDIYRKAYSPDHLEVHFYESAAVRLWEFDTELNKEELAFLKEKVPIKELRELWLISGVAKHVSNQGNQPISDHTALKIMDWLESEEFVQLLVSFQFGKTK
jgi:hypothetical protein